QKVIIDAWRGLPPYLSCFSSPSAKLFINDFKDFIKKKLKDLVVREQSPTDEEQRTNWDWKKSRFSPRKSVFSFQTLVHQGQITRLFSPSLHPVLNNLTTKLMISIK
ncbi:24841_t:CDS:2, partial [Gigaspora rosea]